MLLVQSNTIVCNTFLCMFGLRRIKGEGREGEVYFEPFSCLRVYEMSEENGVANIMSPLKNIPFTNFYELLKVPPQINFKHPTRGEENHYSSLHSFPLPFIFSFQVIDHMNI